MQNNLTQKEKEILNHLQEVYKDTKFPFFSQIKLSLKFGNEIKTELNLLRKKGYIRRREGANKPLVELLKFE